MAQTDANERVNELSKTAQKSSQFGEWNSQTAVSKGYKVLLYGESGSGKTWMAGTFPDPVFLDLEDGMRSLLHHDNHILRYPADPSQTVTSLKDVVDFYKIVRAYPPGKAPFKTIVIDSLNELQVLILKNTLSKFSANRLHDDQPTMADYGKLARDMQSILREFLQLPFHIVLTGTATDREYEEDKIYPMFIGKKTGPDLRRIIEQIGFCYTVQKRKGDPVRHVVSFNDNPLYLAKDRTDTLFRPIPNTFQAMVNPPKEEE